MQHKRNLRRCYEPTGTRCDAFVLAPLVLPMIVGARVKKKPLITAVVMIFLLDIFFVDYDIRVPLVVIVVTVDSVVLHLPPENNVQSTFRHTRTQNYQG